MHFLSWYSKLFIFSEKEKVEGEELEEWLKLVVAPAELALFINDCQEAPVLPLKITSS